MCHQESKERYRLERGTEACGVSGHCATYENTRSLYMSGALISSSFTVNVESTGQYSPEELLPEAIKMLLAKIEEVEVGLDNLFGGQA